MTAPRPSLRSTRAPAPAGRSLRTAFFFLCAVAVVTAVILFPEVALAARRASNKLADDSGLHGQPVPLMGALSGLSLLPFAFIMVTSFAKIAVVLAIIRHALGTNQVPPTQVLTGMALVLTIYVMHPTGLKIKRIADAEADRYSTSILNAKDPEMLKAIATKAVEPVREFLFKHSARTDRTLFYRVAEGMEPPDNRGKRTMMDLSVLVPAFVLTELTEAFQIGFIIFLPFAVIDMIVSNILMALGMQMLQPTTVALPFKLLLFILVDGWFLLTKGLMLGYQ